MKQKILMLKGIPGSGKSFYRKQFILDNPNWKYVNKDEVRLEFPEETWSSQNEKKYLNLERNRGIDYLVQGFNLIVDDTNFNTTHEDYWRNIAEEKDYDFEIKFFDVDLKTCLERNALRENPVPEVAIRSMHNKYIKNAPKFDNRLILNEDPGLTDVYIFDIDGTLALMNGRSAYQLDKVDTDKPNTPVVNLLAYLAEEVRIVLMSGREESARDLTQKWLLKHNIPYWKLIMRKEKDFRGDEIIKKELYEEHIKGRYNVLGVFDDRNKVVDMWRSLGLLCCQVYYGDF